MGKNRKKKEKKADFAVSVVYIYLDTNAVESKAKSRKD
jgi:hypothetical protein